MNKWLTQVTNTRFLQLILALLVSLFAVYPVWAETDPPQQESSTAAVAPIGTGATVQTPQPPQTPQELLQSVKYMVDPKIEDGIALAQQLFGIAPDLWNSEGNSRQKYYVLYSSRVSLTVPYKICKMVTRHEGKFYRIWMEVWFTRNLSFRLTPSMVIEVFGMPDEILTGGPSREDGTYSVGYYYDSQKKNRGYSLHVSFHNPEEYNRTTRRNNKKHSREFIEQEEERRKSYDVHRDYIARVLRLNGLRCYD
jgi:hypothetical protein